MHHVTQSFEFRGLDQTAQDHIREEIEIYERALAARDTISGIMQETDAGGMFERICDASDVGAAIDYILAERARKNERVPISPEWEAIGESEPRAEPDRATLMVLCAALRTKQACVMAASVRLRNVIARYLPDYV